MSLPNGPAGQARGPTTPRPGHVWQRSPARPLAGLPGIFVVVAVNILNDDFKCGADTDFLFSSPEHKVLMVSYCDRLLSVVRRRPSCVNVFT